MWNILNFYSWKRCLATNICANSNSNANNFHLQLVNVLFHRELTCAEYDFQEQRSLKAGELTAQEASNMSASSSRLQTDAFSAEKKAMTSAQSRQTVTSSSGMFSHKEHSTVAHSNMTISNKNLSTKSSLAHVSLFYINT